MSESRRAILDTLRSAADARPAPQPEGPNPGRPTAPANLVEAFASQLEALGVHVHRAADEQEAAAHARRLAGEGEVACSDADLVGRVTEGLETFEGWSDRERLLQAPLGVCCVQAAIAETGTLVLCSKSERHRLVSLVPPVHLALVQGRDLVPDLDAAMEHLSHAGPPPLVSFITGPSRTADIELTLVVGVHGPEELHVILLP